MRRRLPTALGLALLLMAGSAAAKPERLAPGRVVARTSKSGVPYAVYVPKGWRKGQALPLAVHIPTPHKLPFEWLTAATRTDVWAEDGAKVFQCAVLVECHNREDAHMRQQIDVPRFLRLMDRDAAALRAVLDEISAELPIRREAIHVTATGFASEVALGVAVRCPGRIAAVTLTERCVATLASKGDVPRWNILEPRQAEPPARGLHIYLPHATYAHDVAATVAQSHRLKKALLHYGYPHIHFCGLSPDDEVVDGGHEQARKLFLELAEARAERAGHVKKRDETLADGRRHTDRGNLSSALKSYRRARALETMHELDAKSAELWVLLEAQGRAMLAEAAKLEGRKREAAYAKVARLFKDTPLAEEAQALAKGPR